MISLRVLLPQPLGPTMAPTAPGSTAKLIPSRTGRRWPSWTYDVLKFSTSSFGTRFPLPAGCGAPPLLLCSRLGQEFVGERRLGVEGLADQPVLIHPVTESLPHFQALVAEVGGVVDVAGAQPPLALPDQLRIVFGRVFEQDPRCLVRVFRRVRVAARGGVDHGPHQFGIRRDEGLRGDQ